MLLKPLVGSDPEGFIRNKKTGKIVSCHAMLPGTKKEPHKVKGGAIQVDGVAAEINIDPAASGDEFVDNHKLVLKELQYYLGESHEIVWAPIAFFDKSYFRSLPEETQALGCDPDWNAWTGKQNPPPNVGADTVDNGENYFRCAGGHVHVGFTANKSPDSPSHREVCFNIVKFFDAKLIPKSNEWCGDTLRRTLYGKPGACRVKHYGPECRVLSNAWMRSEATMRTVYYRTILATMQALIGRTISLNEYNYMMSKANG